MSQPTLSGFTFLRHGVMLGFPFEASITSILPIVDEFVIAAGKGQDETLERLHALQAQHPKIKIIETEWNENMAERGFVYAQQKMIAQYACTSQWAFYLECDEVVHEQDLENIQASVKLHHDNPAVEALVFDYYHFYGSPQWLAVSPAWYRRECRIIRNSIRTYAPDGQYWLVMHRHKRPRFPQAALANAHIYHYGHVRQQEVMQEKMNQVSRYWSHTPPQMRYEHIDPQSLKLFTGTHPVCMQHWLETQAQAEFRADPNHQLTKRERKHRLAMQLERLTGWDLSHKHYRLVC